MKKTTMLLGLLLMTITAVANQNRRPMLAQGKTWFYIHHHFEDKENPTGDRYPEDYYNESCYEVFYTLNGDTVINGQTYMKMYRSYNWGKQTYYGAFREDEEGRVYAYNYQGDGKDYLLIDFSLHYDNGYFVNAVPIASTIKVGGQQYRRYKYQNTAPDGSTYMLGIVGVEGVGFQEYGLVRDMFAPEPDCICDYESFSHVIERNGRYFSASDFQLPNEIELSADEKQQVAKNNDFAFRLFREARTNESLILSPLSITYALGMVDNGAAGQTQQQINEVLGFDTADDTNALCRKLLNETGMLDPNTKVLIGNTVFVNEGMGIRLQDSFVEKANTYYDAEPQGRDFADGLTRDVINQWASDHTEGMIKEVLSKSEYKEDAVSYLLNALYFKGAWTSEFREENTRKEPFNGGDIVDMMHQNGEFAYTENDLYQAVLLPYGNGAFQMTVYLPREGKTIGDVLAQLNGDNCRFTGHYYEVDLALPRFTTSTDKNLKPIMTQLGMPLAFDLENAEFPYFCTGAQGNIFIGLMKQVAKIDVNEKGTEAAAVTVIGYENSSMPDMATFHADRPFFYTISEQSTGIIFFMGQYMGDTTTGIDETLTESNQASVRAIYSITGQRLQAPPARGMYIENGKKKAVRACK